MKATPTPTTATRTRTTRTATPTTRASALARCIEPLGVEEFLEGYWERRPLVVPRGQEGRFDDLLSRADAERLICSTAIREPSFRLVKAGESPRNYTVDLRWRPSGFTGTADVERALAEFEGGATIVLQALHYSWHPLAVFCRELEAALGHPAQANAYYTPRASQGLAVHHDTHEVIGLQIAGRKRWLVYEPALELPLRDQRYSSELGKPGEAILDVTLSPGDTLYLPRGWLHEAVASDTDSLHLTIGINVYTWLDAFRAALEECADDVEFRRSVPADGEAQAELVGRFGDRLDPAAVAARMRGRLVRSRRPVLDGQFDQLRALESLTAETLVERRPTVIADLAADDGLAVLAFEGKQVAFPARIHEALEFACRREPFSPADLPGALDDSARLVLVRRLVREGFLRVSGVPEAHDERASRTASDGRETPRRT